MTSKLVPKNPAEVMVIRKLSEEITTLSLPFARFGRINIGGRGTLVRLKDGSVAVFSPVALTPEVKQTVASMGELKYITAPDLEHHIFIGPWHQEYPDAKILAPAGLKDKRDKQKNEQVPFTVLFTAANKSSIKVDPVFDDEFDYEFVDGHMNQELVFNHKPSGTLIEADLMFNMPAREQYSRAGPKSSGSGLLTRIWTVLNNTQGDARWQKRFIWYGASMKNRKSFNASMARIAEWNFDRLVPCHGDVIETGAHGVFSKVMAWHLAAAKKAS